MTEEEMQKKSKALQNAVASVRSRRDAIERELSKLERVALFYSFGIDPAHGLKVTTSHHGIMWARNKSSLFQKCQHCGHDGMGEGANVRKAFRVYVVHHPNGSWEQCNELYLCEVCTTLAAGSPVGEADNG